MKSFLISILIALLIFPSAYAVQTKPQVSTPKDFNNGFSVALEVMKEYGLVEESVQSRRLSEIGYRVAQRAAPDMPHFSFWVVKMEEPNAFALPGGFIFVTSGMLQQLEPNDDELAALLGHEIIHVRNEHSRKMGKRQTLMNLLYQALIIGIAFGIKDSESARDPITGIPTRSTKSEILSGTAAFGLVFQELLLRGFSRELELEADAEGMIASARAGFSPQGTPGLFEKMRRNIYEAPGYGYWRTHPYLEDRLSTARSLSSSTQTAKNPADATDYRLKTQQTFLQLIPAQKTDEAKKQLRVMALNAYRAGKTAEDLRWWFIQDAESQENKKEVFYRDYGKLVKVYEDHIGEVEDTSGSSEPYRVELTLPKQDPIEKAEQTSGSSSGFLQKLKDRLKQIHKEKQEVKQLYQEVLGKQMFDTEMLQRFISNFPDDPRIPEVQFRLAENYRLLKKTPQAVELYLNVLKTEGESDWKNKSRQSLLEVLPRLEDLSSVYKVALQIKDIDLKKASEDRMKVLAQSFDSLQIGFEFRRNYPTSEYEKPVREQMTKLASASLNQAKLYQAIGEYQKALDQYNKILRYCSDLPVADQVKDTIVDFQELQSLKS